LLEKNHITNTHPLRTLLRGVKLPDVIEKPNFLLELANAYKIGEKNDLICFDTYQSDCPHTLSFFP
jgi:hypothetical protein